MKLTGSAAEKPYTKKSRDAKTRDLVASPSAIPLWFTNWDGDISDQGMSQTNYPIMQSFPSMSFCASRFFPDRLQYPLDVDVREGRRMGAACPRDARRQRVSRVERGPLRCDTDHDGRCAKPVALYVPSASST